MIPTKRTSAPHRLIDGLFHRDAECACIAFGWLPPLPTNPSFISPASDSIRKRGSKLFSFTGCPFSMFKMPKRQTANKGFCGISSSSQPEAAQGRRGGDVQVRGDPASSSSLTQTHLGKPQPFPGPASPSHTLGNRLIFNTFQMWNHLFR